MNLTPSSVNYYQIYSYETPQPKATLAPYLFRSCHERDVFHILNSFCGVVTLYEWVTVCEKHVSILTLYFQN